MIPHYAATFEKVDVVLLTDPNSSDVTTVDGVLQHHPDMTDEDRYKRAVAWHVIGLQDAAADEGVEEGSPDWPTAPHPDMTIDVETRVIVQFPWPMQPRTGPTGPCK